MAETKTTEEMIREVGAFCGDTCLTDPSAALRTLKKWAGDVNGSGPPEAVSEMTERQLVGAVYLLEKHSGSLMQQQRELRDARMGELASDLGLGVDALGIAWRWWDSEGRRKGDERA